MNVKRERLQVIFDILRAIQDKNGKIKPTHIMYKANLSYTMLDEYLKELAGKGFITSEETKEGKFFSLSQKGFDYIHKYKYVIDFAVSFGLSE